MDEAFRQIVAKPVSREVWAPFGWLPVADTDPLDTSAMLEFAWDDVHVNRISHRRDEVPRTGAVLRCEMMFRHLTHTQVLMPLDARAVVVVAPPGVEMTSPDNAAEARAFLLEPLQSIVLHRGTWHWGPFPVVADAVELFNIQGRRYREDNDCADLAALGASLEVHVGG
jgi:ureidoglycolate hydrolase